MNEGFKVNLFENDGESAGGSTFKESRNEDLEKMRVKLEGELNGVRDAIEGLSAKETRTEDEEGQLTKLQKKASLLGEEISKIDEVTGQENTPE